MAGSLRLTLDYRWVVERASPEGVFQVAEHWMKAEGAKVKVTRPGVYIEGAHGTKFQMVGWKPNASKSLQVTILQGPSGTGVALKIVPSAFYYPDIEMFGAAKASQNFGQLAGRLAQMLAVLGEVRAFSWP